jgi:hypothetical protein
VIFYIIILVAAAFGIGAIIGAPYLPVLGRDSAALLDLADLATGQTIIDLGSGDGRFLLAAARRGYRAIGYEINPLLWLLSLVVCWPVRDRVKIYCRDFWRVSLPPADAIYVFLIDRFMSRLDQKLTRELTRPTKMISYVFAVPGKQPRRATKNSYLYTYGNSSKS